MSQVERDPRLSFDEVADIYHEIRPGYPEALFADLFAVLPDALSNRRGCGW